MVDAAREDALAWVRRSLPQRFPFIDGDFTCAYIRLLSKAIESSSLETNIKTG